MLPLPVRKKSRTLPPAAMIVDTKENDPLVDSPGVTVEAVRHELKQITSSRHFRTSKRSQQFLEYVVEQKLLGNEANIKERTIGIDVFGRQNNYVTGDDPVVRVQAGEVRRRLERYLADVEGAEGLRVELATGTYVPVFRFHKFKVAPEVATSFVAGEPELAPEVLPLTPEAESGPMSISAPVPLIVPPSSAVTTITPPPTPASKAAFPPFARGLLLIAVALGIGLIGGYFLHTPQRTPEVIQKFWGPVLGTQKAVIINLGRPFVYLPNKRLFDLYGKDHPGIFDKALDRHNHRLPLSPDTPMTWADMFAVINSGPAEGGVRGGIAVGSFLGKFGKEYTVRFGDDGSFLNLRDAPSVIIGAMNNSWTSEMEKDFHFRIRENSSGGQIIEEAGSNRVWTVENTSDHEAHDYALITRQPVGATGQFLVKVAGLQDAGTEAAAQFVTNPEMLKGIASQLPANWRLKNLQIVIETDVISSAASPPKVLAVYTW